jgi:YD repeat-containing protein
MKPQLHASTLLVSLAVCLVSVTTADAETYSYDGAGRLTGVVFDNDDTISYDYDANGNLLERVSVHENQQQPNEPPSVLILGGNRIVPNSDALAGELVSFTATATDDDGTVETTEWIVNGSVVATGLTADIALPDGQTVVIFRAVDDDGDPSTDSVTITVEAPPLEEGWPVPYSGITPDESLGLEFNNISAFNPEDGLIYSCLRVLLNGEQSDLDGIEAFDIAFEVVSLVEGTIRLVKIKPFNATGALNENGELPDCSGSIEMTTGVYSDLVLVGSDVLGVAFELFDPANLILRLIEIELVATMP